VEYEEGRIAVLLPGVYAPGMDDNSRVKVISGKADVYVIHVYNNMRGRKVKQEETCFILLLPDHNGAPGVQEPCLGM
jgi:hypothetical protein